MTALVTLTRASIALLHARGVECLLQPGTRLPADTVLEPPCSLKWLEAHHSLSIGAFSYAVRGYAFAVRMGRYCSIGEAVQLGRGSHPTAMLSTSPAFYRQSPLFEVGHDWPHAAAFHAWRPPPPPRDKMQGVRPITIGNDVYIGHGALVMPGITIGDGAIVGAMSVVTRDVPAYAVVAGNPARLIRMRVADALVPALLAQAWWRFAPWQLAGLDVTDPARAAAQLPALTGDLVPYAPPRLRLGDLPTGD